MYLIRVFTNTLNCQSLNEGIVNWAAFKLLEHSADEQEVAVIVKNEEILAVKQCNRRHYDGCISEKASEACLNVKRESRSHR